MGHAILISSRNCSVNTDRWAAAVVAIDQLPRKIASVTDTKREKNAMSEDKINEEQRTATQTVAKALDDAIGDDDPVEHETAILARDQDGGHLGRPLTPTSSKTGKHATKSPFGPHHVRSYWTPERKREAAGDEDPTREHVNARKKGKSALDASPGVETPRKHDTTSKQSDRDGSPPPTPAEAEVEFDGRASSDDEDARKVEIAQYSEQHWRNEDWCGVDVDYSLVRLRYQPFKELDIVFAKVEGVWYAGSISKIIKRSRYIYYIHTYADGWLEDMYKRDLLLFTKEAFERMAADATNLECAEARLCHYYAAIEYNCKCKHFQRKIKLGEEWRNLNTNIPKRLHDKVRSTVWYKDLMERHNQLKLVEGTRP